MDADEIRQQIARMKANEVFASAGRVTDMLEYCVERVLSDTSHDLKEYALGVDVFGRGASFDPKTDAIVRVTAGKLRSKLAEYYQNGGSGDTIHIEFPKGTYVPAFTYRRQQNRYIRAGGAAAAVAVLAALCWAFVPRWNSSPHHALLVLPFANLTGNADDEFMADGLTEEVIDTLSRIEGLSVVARTSAFQFKGKSIDLREAGHRVRANLVVEGSIRRSGPRLRLSAKLSRTNDGFQIWSETFDQESKDPLDIQSRVARRIASKLDLLEWLPKQANRASVDEEVFRLTMQGFHHLGKATRTGSELALRCFEEAVKKDEKYAPAWVGLADVHASPSGLAQGRLPDTNLASAKSALDRAIQSDSSYWQAYVTLATLKIDYEWDFNEAENALKEALRLNPGAARAHGWYSVLLSWLGRTDESVRHAQISSNLDPISSPTSVRLANSYMFARRYDEALAIVRTNVADFPDRWGNYLTLGLILDFKGQHEAAIEALRKIFEISKDPDNVGPTGALAHAYGRAGKQDEARRLLAQIQGMSQSRYVSPMVLARVYVGLGETERVFEELDKGYRQKDPLMLWLGVDPRFDAVRADRRYGDLVRKIGIATR